MPNPYSTGSWLPNLAPQIANFTDNLVRLKTHQDDIDMRGRALQQGQSQFDAALPLRQGELDVARGNLTATQDRNATLKVGQALEQQKFETANPHATPWNMSNFARLNSKLKLAGVPVDDLPFINDLKAFAADPSMLRGDVAGAIEMKWPEWSAQAAETLSQKVGKLTDQAAAMPENDPKRKEVLGQIEKTVNAMKLMESIPADKIKQTLFPDIHQYDQNQKAELMATKNAFSNELLNQRFEQYKDIQGLKFQNQKDLQDAKFQMLKDLKMSNAFGDTVGRNILASGYREQLRDVDIQIRNMNPLMFENDAAFQAARIPLEQRRDEIMADLKDLSGVAPKKEAGKEMAAMPPAGQHKGKIIRDTETGKRFQSNGSAWVEVK
jgi:hypothetical protein